MNTSKVFKTKVPWFCLLCWQEGEVEIERDHRVEDVSKPVEFPEVVVRHREIVKGIMGGTKKCRGDIRAPQKTKRLRFDKSTLTSIDLEQGEPIRL